MAMLQNQHLERPAGEHHQSPYHIPVSFFIDGSKQLIHGDDGKRVMSSILALRRGPIRYPRNKVIAFEEGPTDYLFVVVKGVVRTCKTFQDGSRTIIGFHVPGEYFGLNDDLKYSLSAEAATEAMVLFLKRSALLTLAAHDSRVAGFLLARTASELRRVQEHSLLIGRDAKCRVAAFLIDLSVRTGQAKYLELPMRHRDIADYLGLKIETLSRAITELERSGWVARASTRRTVILRDRASLMNIVA